ncbi:MAG: DNA-binding protein [Desulfobacteraceae bacterium]|nr:MAG: DNA-binding protein [Desulfobacteraceae bacterium]
MKYSEAATGRVFIIRLEDGDVVHEVLEQFAAEKQIRAASCIILGGADENSTLVVGPEEARAQTVVPQTHVMDHVHEVAGTGTIFPDDKGNPLLHMHMACGSGKTSLTGCIRQGVKVWHVMEVIMTELVGSSARRVMDRVTGFELLEP